MSCPADDQRPWSATQGWRSLAVVAGLMTLIWLVVLPAIGRWTPVATRIQANKAAGVDPSVKFYSELPVMPSVQRHMERLHQREPSLFW